MPLASPELALTLGCTWIAAVDLTGTAYGGSSTLTFDAGDVTLATLAFRPEIVIPPDGLPVAEALSLASFTPGLTCKGASGIETWTDCGYSPGFGLRMVSGVGPRRFSADIDILRVGPRSDTSISLGLEQRF